jgi:predicted nucleic acid-binding protein
MGEKGVDAFLSRHKKVGLDTMVFIYHLEDHPRYGPLTQRIFEALEAGENRGVTSVIALLELLVRPKVEGREEVAREYLHLLTTYPNLAILAIDVGVAEIAAELRAKYGVRTPDALQLAAAVQAGATGFITNDRRLEAIKELEIGVLDDLLG